MKRILVILSLIVALFAASSCTYETDLSVTASAELIYDDLDVIPVGPVSYEGYHMTYLSDRDLEDIFIDLTQHVNFNGFRTGILNVEIFDKFSDRHLRDEAYGFVYNSNGYFDISEIPL